MADRHTNQKILKQYAYDESNKLDLRNEIQETHGQHPVPWFEWIFDQVDLTGQMRVLEIGGGSGELWSANRKRIPHGIKAITSDLSFGMIQAARQLLSDPLPQVSSLVFDGQAIPFPIDTFDAVLAVGVLDHVPNLHQLLREVRRVLRPSGQFYASAGGRAHLSEFESLLKGIVPEERAEALGGEEARFGLENGARLLRPHFDLVMRDDYVDTLVFDETQPVIDYLLSENSVLSGLTLVRMTELIRRVKQSVHRPGGLRVTVRKGLFTSR